ncbi:MAG TPA: hypothetical protein VF050_08125, partial [Moraxellaceae bacterium]
REERSQAIMELQNSLLQASSQKTQAHAEEMEQAQDALKNSYSQEGEALKRMLEAMEAAQK